MGIRARGFVKVPDLSGLDGENNARCSIFIESVKNANVIFKCQFMYS